MIIKIIYSIFIGVLLAVLVGVGIAAFYESPKPPDFISSPYPAGYPPTATQSAEVMKQQEQQNAQMKTYQEEFATYNNHVAMIALAFAIVYLTVSLTVVKLPVFADGVLYGGLLTLGYSVVRIMMGNNSKYQFIFVCVALLVTVAVGYVKFIKPKEVV